MSERVPLRAAERWWRRVTRRTRRGCSWRLALVRLFGERTLGEGNFGKVKHVRHRATGDHFAVKILDLGRVLSLHGADDQVRREIVTLTMLAHPNVVRLHEVFTN
ncbi:hypothetical protein ZWY2020_012281 [Hordeum vulgare]|nr:hypothetical protein ZWY2020_012281 [Hordeum vulgare]